MNSSQEMCSKHHCPVADCDERTHNFTVRLSGRLQRAAKARAAAERPVIALSEVIRGKVEDYAAGTAEPEAVAERRRAEAAEQRAEAAQRELGRVAAELAALRASVAADPAGTSGGEEGFITALEGAMSDAPVARARLIAVSGWTEHWVKTVLHYLVEEGYATRTETGFYAHVPGTDLREGYRAARRAVQHETARITPGKREARDGTSPAPDPDVAAAEATETPEAQSAARKEGPRKRGTATGERAVKEAPPLVAANGREAVIADLRERAEAIAPGTVMFRQPEPGAELVVTAEVPEAADHAVAPGKPRGSSRKRCEHRLPAGAWCKTCQQPK